MWPDAPWVVGAADGAAAVPEPTDGADASNDFAERLLRRFLRLCESPRTRSTVLRLVRGSVSGQDAGGGAGGRFYTMLNRTVLSPVARVSGLQTSATRMELVASQLIGLAMMRYVLEVEPVSSLPLDDVVAMMAPAIRATLASPEIRPVD
ncbi:TetR/AcrR family transcriptional regulator [Nocardioides terrisoli]|uniref:TetR/AcrR family transcriptional regulator n=1 Tax=Nocardioides terrisoli TaxID=3388267 RepID=UPI00287B6A71|nr:hypothetical protein [Nocardioides marmorisolisilvae]